MTIRLGVVMDPIAEINFKKDSTLAMLWEAQHRKWQIFYMAQSDLFIKNGEVFAHAKRLTVFDDEKKWFEFNSSETLVLADLNIILMRKDPPFDLEYIYTTYLLELAEHQGVLVVNKPQSLRDANEKLFTNWFPQCCPPTLITRNLTLLRDFYEDKKDIVCKPLNAMGGAAVFRIKFPDENATVIFETLTHSGKTMIAAQSYIPEIKQGDKRILLINGEPVPFALARIPAKGELRGNLAAGGQGVAQPLTERDRWICTEVGATLREKGLLFVGLDVIGDFLTEINVTSPTCVRELDAQCQLNISAIFLDQLEGYVK